MLGRFWIVSEETSHLDPKTNPSIWYIYFHISIISLSCPPKAGTRGNYRGQCENTNRWYVPDNAEEEKQDTKCFCGFSSIVWTLAAVGVIMK